MASIRFENVTKTYEGATSPVVPNLNLEIKDKEFIILVGPSGCGKSTTLRMIAGLESITEGEMYIGDRLMNKVPSKDRDIAMVFQNYALYPHMNVYKNIAFGLKLRKEDPAEIDKRVHEAAKILDLEHLLTRKPKELSGGQRQRVALGRAMVRNPAVFLLDEPLSNLDAKLRVQMRAEISKLHQRLGSTIIYVTHDQTEAMTLGTRIVVMKDGIVQQMDTPQNLYNHPANVFVASFIGSPQMNFLDAVCEIKDGAAVLKAGGCEITLDAEKSKALSDGGYNGKTVVMGIRPEDIYDAGDMPENFTHSIVEAPVTMYELLGAEVYLYFDLQGTTVTARVASTTNAQTGEKMKFALDLSKIHLFDKETEKTILG